MRGDRATTGMPAAGIAAGNANFVIAPKPFTPPWFAAAGLIFLAQRGRWRKAVSILRQRKPPLERMHRAFRAQFARIQIEGLDAKGRSDEFGTSVTFGK